MTKLQKITTAIKILNELDNAKYYLECNGYDFSFIAIIAEIYISELPPLHAELKRNSFNR